MVTPTYDIRAFQWNQMTRTFYQDAWHLEWMDDDHQMAAFPNMKNPFYIKNTQTEKRRLFVFVEELNGCWHFVDEESDTYCSITVDPF
jgi:hypothetical protein